MERSPHVFEMTEEVTLAFRNMSRFAATHVKERLDRFLLAAVLQNRRQGAPVTTSDRETPRRGTPT